MELPPYGPEPYASANSATPAYEVRMTEYRSLRPLARDKTDVYLTKAWRFRRFDCLTFVLWQDI